MGCTNGVAAAPGRVVSIASTHDTPAFEQEYAVGEILGKGAFGRVYAASHRLTGRQCAVKIVEMADKQFCQKAQREQESVTHKKVMQEIEVWQAVGRHPNIVEFRGWFVKEHHALFMVMERCFGTVTETFSPGTFREAETPWLLREMLLGVQACHRVNVVHRDIKADNFLVSNDGRRIMLCDLGLAAQLKPGASGASLRGETGTPPLMSPEMLQGKWYGTGTDVWSFGAMVYFILFNELPYIPDEVTSKAAKQAVRAGTPKPRFLEEAAHPAVAFLRGLLERDPADRVTAKEALQHFYLQKQFPHLIGHVSSGSTLAPEESSVGCFSSADSQDESALAW